MRLTDLEIAYTMEVLSNLTESAEKYIDDGSWLEPLTDDIKSAQKVLKKYAKILEKEQKREDVDIHKALASAYARNILNGQQVGEVLAIYRGMK